jgi:phosphatidylglycerol:prolipoprotein diacylglycerol transferase
MITYPAIDPVAFHIFSWPVHWYGLMYLIGFLGGWGLLALRVRLSPELTKDPNRYFTQNQVSDLAFFAALGAIIGGRLGYILFYDWQVLFTNPLLIVETWKGGMSFHGGLLGVLVALAIYAKKLQKPFLALTDFLSPVIPIGLGAGRIGNFINDELWGRVTEVPWGMIFPNGGSMVRHPSQLYEFALEGVLLFLVLWFFSSKPRPLGAVSGLFALGYGLFRSFAEFFREPDVQIGYLAGGITEGQVLSLPLILAGIILLSWAYKKGKVAV